MNYKQLKQNLHQKKLAQVYLLYGEEHYLIEETVQCIEQLVFDNGVRDFNYQLFYGEEASGADIINAAHTMPMMAKKRLLLVKHVEQMKAPQLKKLTAYAAQPSTSAILILTGDNLDNKKTFVKSLASPSVAVRFYPLYDSGAIAWIQAKVKKEGYRISPEAGRGLLELSGNDLAALANQLEKLFAYTASQKNISLEDVDLVVGRVRQHNIFELVEAIGSKKLERALHVLAKILAQGEPPILVMAMISRQLRRIWRAKCMLKQGVPWNAIGQKLGVPRFILKNFTSQVEGFSLSDLQAAFHALLATDIKLKTGTQWPRLSLEFLLLKLCR